MTAVTMIFEMTRDYNIVLPMILAVAMALGVRRMVSRENLYTLKLIRRGHPIPKALHANMFLVQSAAEIMERDVLVLEEMTSFASFNELAAAQGGLQHVVVTRGGVIVGGLHVDADFRHALGATPPEVNLKALMQQNFTIVQETDVAFDLITMMGRKRATMAIVVSHLYEHEAQRVLGVVTKAHVADAVVRSIELYP